MNTAARGAGPRTHALIIGVSDYPALDGAALSDDAPTFGLRSLSSPALSAFTIAEWLKASAADLAAPLGSCELLLAPSRAEIRVDPRLAAFDRGVRQHRPTRENVSRAADRWRRAASVRSEDFALFYFAGHGIQRVRFDQVLLLEGFGEPDQPLAFAEAFEFTELWAGMSAGPTRPSIARNQLYFVDACRSTPRKLVRFDSFKASPLWDIGGCPIDDRNAPIFYAASPGRTAAGVRRERSFFSAALLACLDGRAAREEPEGAWCVSTLSLQDHLQAEVDRLSRKHRVSQAVRYNEVGQTLAIRHFRSPPDVPVEIEVDPAADAGHAKLAVFDDAKATVLAVGEPIDPHPYKQPLPAGQYEIELRSSLRPSAKSEKRFYRAVPPEGRWRIRLIS